MRNIPFVLTVIGLFYSITCSAASVTVPLQLPNQTLPSPEQKSDNPKEVSKPLFRYPNNTQKATLEWPIEKGEHRSAEQAKIHNYQPKTYCRAINSTLLRLKTQNNPNYTLINYLHQEREYYCHPQQG